MSKKIKFNVLDFVIILFSVLAILSALFWNDIRAEFVFDEKTVEYTFCISGLSEEMLSSIKVDDNLYFAENGKSAGTILSLKSEKSAGFVVGTVKAYEIDTYTVIGTAEAKGRQRENGFYINDEYFIVNGKYFDVETSKVSVKLQITDIKY